MAKFVYLYTGGQMAETPEAQQEEMQKWGAWFGELGAALTEGGNPFGGSATLAADGTVSTGGASAVSGYSIVSADSLDEATAKAKGCPVLVGGGAVEVYQALEM